MIETQMILIIVHYAYLPSLSGMRDLSIPKIQGSNPGWSLTLVCLCGNLCLKLMLFVMFSGRLSTLMPSGAAALHASRCSTGQSSAMLWWRSLHTTTLSVQSSHMMMRK